MNQEQKNKLTAAAQQAAVKAADKARTSTGWRKWLYFLAALAAAGIALFTASSCAAGFVQTEDKTAGIILILPLEK